ncbi:DUF3093 domain-containing protein [Aquipuribacter sp. SD81]|uniref:DUF3093 domain-containing protein n=1 Tax=Aquipuribacter sp. SD81 TaxID=3127703 RepID=UPI003018F9C0
MDEAPGTAAARGHGSRGGPRVAFRERLWPAAWVWLSGVVVAATLGVVFVPATSLLVAAVAGVLALAGVAALLAWWSPVVRVVEPAPGTGWWLQAGDARIPLAALGAPEPLDAAAMRRALGPGLDARSHRLIRGWVATGVRVEVTDPRDPVPYWLLSSRRPARLSAALTAPTADG